MHAQQGATQAESGAGPGHMRMDTSGARLPSLQCGEKKTLRFKFAHTASSASPSHGLYVEAGLCKAFFLLVGAHRELNVPRGARPDA
eukprot:scaffold5250_cov102-Isochrysis_galbana.AAC.1